MKKKAIVAFKIIAMKIAFVQLLIMLFVFSAAAKKMTGQEILDRPVSLFVENIKIKDALQKIQKIADVKFVFSSRAIDANRKVSFNVSGKKLGEFLNEIILPLHINYKLINGNIILFNENLKASLNPIILENAPPAESVANRDISGKVTNQEGDPLSGVSVFIKGTKTGTTTDAQGRFRLSVPENVNIELELSFVGYRTMTVSAGRKSEIIAKLVASEAGGLEEVVVIGYGTQKKVTLTGAVSSVKGEDIKAVPTGPIANTLVGRMPGLIAKNTSGEPGFDDSRLLIRGNNTLGNNSPLIVVDGVADRAGGFSRIDVNDVESVTILKDASAAIYGSRAANGVILVTTKRGKTGKTNITYSTNYGLKSPTILPDMIDAADYATAINDITRLIDKNPVPTYTAAEIQKFRDGSDPVNYPNIDPMKEALKSHSIQKRHSLTVSGGSQNVKYFTSLGYQYEDNIYKNSASNYKQYNLRSNLDIQANDYLRFFANLSLRQEDRNSPYQSGFGSGEIWRNIVQGDPRQLLVYPNGLRRAVTSGGYNPLTAVDGTTGYRRDKSTHINADIGFNWDFSKITKGLGIDGRLSIDKSNNFFKSFNKAWVLYTLNNSTGEYLPNRYGPTNALLNESMNQSLGITAIARLLYNRVFNKVHNISTFVAYEQYENKFDYLRGQRQDFVSTSVDQLFAGDARVQVNDGTASEVGRQNYFGRFDYSYSEKYLLQFNWRYDGSAYFPKENRFGFYPGISLGWRASEENFWKQNFQLINYFKIRGSWGKMGNDQVVLDGQDRRYSYLTTYTFGQNGVFGGANPAAYTGLVQVQTANPNVSWEVGTTYNLGFEAKFLKNAFSFEMDFFRQNRDKILAQPTAVVNEYAGLTLPAVNDASCKSGGVEASLSYNRFFGNVRFNIGGNFTYAKSEIINKNEAAATPEWQKQAGKPIGANWLLYEAIGIYRTSAELAKYPGLGNADIGDLIFRDVDNNGVLDANDRIRLNQSETPQIIYGFNLGASWKQLELSMLWQGAGKVSTYTFYEGGAGGIGNYTHSFFDNRWTPENPNASGPRIIDRERTPSAKPNTFFLNDASYLRLKNIELTYSLPKNLLSRLHVSNCNVFVSGFNLLTFTGVKDIDPEATVSGQGYAGWFNIQSKVFNFGLNLTF
ncbi:MAG: TonB-dependent receptor [Ferruginibacter sp.]|nr:TonB-dependent receptor [Ferruginibacter sp.]